MSSNYGSSVNQNLSATLDELHQSYLEKIKEKLIKTNSQADKEAMNAETSDPRLNASNLNSLPGNLGNNLPNNPLSAGLQNSSSGLSSAAAAASHTQNTTPGVGNDRQLADFFQNLLKKGSGPAPRLGTPTAPSSTGNRNPSNNDALAKSPLGNMLLKNRK